jgi:hypothetical protein
MTPDEREALEREVRGLCEQGAPVRAAEAAIRGYGPELLGVLAATHRGEEAAGFEADIDRLLPGARRLTEILSCAGAALPIPRSPTQGRLRGTSREHQQERKHLQTMAARRLGHEHLPLLERAKAPWRIARRNGAGSTWASEEPERSMSTGLPAVMRLPPPPTSSWRTTRMFSEAQRLMTKPQAESSTTFAPASAFNSRS